MSQQKGLGYDLGFYRDVQDGRGRGHEQIDNQNKTVLSKMNNDSRGNDNDRSSYQR